MIRVKESVIFSLCHPEVLVSGILKTPSSLLRQFLKLLNFTTLRTSYFTKSFHLFSASPPGSPAAPDHLPVQQTQSGK